MTSLSKRPYERPRLEATEIFGLEAATGSCCRSNPHACKNPLRDVQRTTIDPLKVRVTQGS